MLISTLDAKSLSVKLRTLFHIIICTSTTKKKWKVNKSHFLTLNLMSWLGGVLLKLFKSYFLNRQQYLQISNNCISLSVSLDKYGGPQGSVLCSLLFSPYMLPLGNISRKHDVSRGSHADDIHMYISCLTIPHQPHISCYFSSWVTWVTEFFLSLDAEKTEALLFEGKSAHTSAVISALKG